MLGGGYFNGGDEVLFPVGAQGADGKLGTGEDDRLGKVLEHEAECGGCIGHRIGTVQDDEAVEIVVVVVDDFYNLCPEGRFSSGTCCSSWSKLKFSSAPVSGFSIIPIVPPV